MPKPRSRAKFTGRSEGKPFVQLHRYILDSEEFGNLTGAQTKLLLEITRKHNSFNNGNLSVAYNAETRARGWKSKPHFYQTRAQLIESGWLIVTRGGCKRLCHLFAISFFPICDVPRHGIKGETFARNTWRKNQGPLTEPKGDPLVSQEVPCSG